MENQPFVPREQWMGRFGVDEDRSAVRLACITVLLVLSGCVARPTAADISDVGGPFESPDGVIVFVEEGYLSESVQSSVTPTSDPGFWVKETATFEDDSGYV